MKLATTLQLIGSISRRQGSSETREMYISGQALWLGPLRPSLELVPFSGLSEGKQGKLDGVTSVGWRALRLLPDPYVCDNQNNL